MTANLESGTYRVVSLIDGKPSLGISHILPGFQFVLVNGPVQQCLIHRRGDGKLLLSIGGYPYTGVIDNKVAASTNFADEMGWEVTYRQLQNAFTIARGDDPSVGWTVTEDNQVEIQPIKETRSIPPQYSTGQLFTFLPFE